MVQPQTDLCLHRTISDLIVELGSTASMAFPGATAWPPWLRSLSAAFQDMISHFWRPATSPGRRTPATGAAGENEDGSTFFDAHSQVWQRHPDVARYNPPAATLPLPFRYYGQPFFKGFGWETKV